MSDGQFVVAFIVGVVTFILLVILCVGTGGYYVSKSSCHSFSRQTNREVKFVKYNLVSWDCLTPSGDGKWIPTSQLRDIDP